MQVLRITGVMAAITRLKPNLSPAPGHLPHFKPSKYSHAKPFTLIYNQLLSDGAAPDEWKSVIIMRVH